ncbi:hypothetical protein PYCCODRAFT_1465292 [Trametes coccinea BRFM310]|uniref:Flo11 domain-containing protein n=1 Tax=Trametes coccinea (strain BRFM310) TaxID=1353009 RepID=A0A1Y2IWA1_TRAC3|nr:hypothetical protein PYCCODRAFT_1465292 [Trametes coccinea BRFM310]
MVVLSPHFTFLAALSSIAAVSLLPVPAEAAAIHLQSRDAFGHSLAARHSAHGTTDDSADHQQSSSSKVKHASKKAAVKKAAAKPQRHPKPVMPLPALMAQKSAHKGSSSSTETDGGGKKHTQGKSSKHTQSGRAAWESSDPISRVQNLWLGSRDLSSQDAVSATLPPRLSRRHHHDSHGHHHDEVIVKGNDDRVDMHHRSLKERGRSRSARDDHDRVTVEGHNDHVHYHDHGHDDHDHVVVKGDNDHVHVQRSPSPHHHHHHTTDRVIVKGDHDSVHVHRSPSPAPHSHGGHHDKVVVKGDHDHVKVHGRSSAPQRRRHHHHTVVVKGNNEHVHVGRSPLPAPEPHHHHHHDKDKVIVKGDDDHVNVHGRRGPGFGYRSPIVISGNGGDAFLLHHDMMSMSQASTYDTDGDLLDMKLHLRRDGQVNGVPGSIEIMSPVANSDIGERIASLVMAAPSNGSTADNSTSSSFVLNASEGDRTQMYLVTVPDSGYSASATNDTASNSTTPSSYIKVALQMPVFDAASAQLKPYCATFDPRPAAPAPMTVEYCMDGSTVDEHKSQSFAYKPDTGAIWPMWYDGEDDGTGGGDSVASPADSDSSTSDSSDDDEGSTAGSDGTTVDPTTPTSDKVASVTSFNDQALDEQYGDATRPPARAAFAKTFSADALSSARNVTLVFSPAAPEVPASPPAQKMAVPVSSSDSGTSSVASVTLGDSSATPTSTDTATTSLTDFAASSTFTSDGTSSDIPTSVPSASSTSATDSDSTAEASATSSPALEVKVYNPYAEDLSSEAGSSSTSMTTASATISASTSSMTPVSTAPYEWMFKQGALTDLE